MPTALYRITSGECVKVSLQDQPFTDRNTTYWGVLTDPITPDGTDARDLSGPEPGELRVLGWAKIALPGSNTVRNATQVEIDTFAAAEATDEAAQDAEEAANLTDTHPLWRKVVKAILKGIIRENNLQAAQFNALRAEILSANNLASLQSGVTANTTDMPVRTNQQAYTAVRTDVSGSD